MLGIVIIRNRSAGSKSVLNVPPRSGAGLPPRGYAQCCYNAVNFLTYIHKRHPIARPLGRGMVCLLLDTASDYCSATVPVIIYVISEKIGPRHNGTWLYFSTPNHRSGRLVAIGETVMLVPYHFGKSPQIIRRSSSRLRTIDLEAHSYEVHSKDARNHIHVWY